MGFKSWCKENLGPLWDGANNLISKLPSRDIKTEVGGQQIDAKDNAKVSVSNTQNTGPVVNISEKPAAEREQSAPQAEMPSAIQDNVKHNAIANSGSLIQINIGNIDSLFAAANKVEKENLKDIFFAAAQMLLPEAGQTSNLNQDWELNYIKHAQTVSEPKLKELWAKILAGEICNSGSVSKKTMSLLCDLETEDAQLFQNATRFFWNNDLYRQSGFTNPNLSDLKPSIEEINGYPNYSAILTFSSLGLIDTAQAVRKYAIPVSNKFEIVASFYERSYAYRLLIKNLTAEKFILRVPCYFLTRPGAELCRVLGGDINKQYLELLSRNIEYILGKRGEHRFEYCKTIRNGSGYSVDETSGWKLISHNLSG